MRSQSSRRQKSTSLRSPATAEQKMTQQSSKAEIKLRKDWYANRNNDFHKSVCIQRDVLVQEEKVKRHDQESGQGGPIMTNTTKDAIIGAKFDFAALSGCISDIRKGFWNVERINSYYRNKVKQTHSHFYQQIIPGRAQDRMFAAAKLRKGGFMKNLKLVVDPRHKVKQAKKKVEPKFESGSERDSRQGTLTQEEENEMEAASWEQTQGANNVDIDLDYQPIVIEKQANNLNQLIQHSETSDLSVERKKKAILVQMLDQAIADSDEHPLQTNKKEQLQQLQIDLELELQPQMRKGRSLQMTNVIPAVELLEYVQSARRNTDQFNSAQPTNNTTKARIQRSQTNYNAKENNPNSKSSRKKLSRRESKNKVSSQKNPASQQYFDDMTKEHFFAELMSDSDLERITFTLFDLKLRDKELLHELAALLSFHLSEKHKLEYDFQQVKQCLPHVDKTLFIEFRDAKITLAQLKSRVAERRGFAKYKVFDDVYSELTREEREKMLNSPNAAQLAKFLFGKDPQPGAYSRELEPWESNPRCLRSIKYHHNKGGSSKSARQNNFSLSTEDKTHNGQSMKQSRTQNAQATINSDDKVSKVSKVSKKDEQTRRPSVVQPQFNSLLDEKQLKSKKARLNKDQELRKYMSSLHKLKRKLAKQIVDKSGKIEEFKQLTLDDLFKFSAQLENQRIQASKNKLSVFKNCDQEAKEKILEDRWQKKVENAMQEKVQVFSSAFEFDTNLTEQQADLHRLHTKMNDPYTYFQERQNRIVKTYELMAVYKTVYNIEKEIKEAQTRLSQVSEYYDRSHGRYSPTKSEYDYIRRLVDDGEPVVITKKMRKAMKIKDEMETLETAIKTDLKDAGYQKVQIEKMEGNEIDASDEDSMERRKRKAIKEAKKAAGLPTKAENMPKRITKKEKAHRAFLAERHRQKVLKPMNNETIWQQQRRLASSLKKRCSSQSLLQKKYAQAAASLIGVVNESGDTFHTSQQPNTANESTSFSYMQKQKTKIEVKKLPKYYSSKLITRNQSGFQLNKNIEIEQLSTKEEAKQQNPDLNLNGNNSTDLLGSTIAVLQSAEASPSTKDDNRTGVRGVSGRLQHRRSISTFQLKSLKKFHQSARSVTTNKMLHQQRPSSDMNVVIKIDECDLSETNNRPNVMTPISSEYHENELSAEVRNFVQAYGIPVQQHCHSGQTVDRTISTTVAGGAGVLSKTKEVSAHKHTYTLDFRNSISMLSGSKATPQTATQQDGVLGCASDQRLFSRLDSEDDFMIASPERENLLEKQQKQYLLHEQLQDQRGSSATSFNTSASRERGSHRHLASSKVRATTAKQVASFRFDGAIQQRRQDLDFNGRREIAERAMKEQKLLLFQQKLHQNQQRAVWNNTQEVQSEEIIRSIENARKVATNIGEQAERNLSSDYNTKAIATRLRSIANRRIQTAKQKVIAAASVGTGQYSRTRFDSTRNVLGLASAEVVGVNPNGTDLPGSHYLRTNRPNSQYQLTEGSYAAAQGQTLKASTQNNSNQNLVAAHGPNAVGDYIVGQREIYRAQSGIDPQTGRVTIHKVTQRHDTLSPFDDIPITSGKKVNRPKTGARHLYIDQGDKNENQLFGNKTSAQTLLA